MLSSAQSGLAEWQQRSSVPPLHSSHCSKAVCGSAKGQSRTVTACCARSPGPLREKILLWDIMVISQPCFRCPIKCSMQLFPELEAGVAIKAQQRDDMQTDDY